MKKEVHKSLESQVSRNILTRQQNYSSITCAEWKHNYKEGYIIPEQMHLTEKDTIRQLVKDL